MRVKIEEIRDKPLDVTAPIAREVLVEALADSEGYGFVSATPLKATFLKVSGQVHVHGEFEATLTAPCRRCVDEVTLTVPVEFSLRMVPDTERRAPVEDDLESPRHARRQKPEDDGRAKNAGTFEIDQADAEPFDGKTIDLDPVVREQVLLALPVAVLCREDCKGLCTVCGQELNERDCGHSSMKEVDVRLAKLKDIKLKQ